MLLLIGEEILIRDGAGKLITRLVAHDDPMLYGFELVGQGSDQGHQIGIDEYHLVAGVVDYVGNLVSKESDVHRVANPARIGGCPVELMMTLVVPGKCRYGIANLQSQRVESRCELSHPGVGRSVGRSGQGFVTFH